MWRAGVYGFVTLKKEKTSLITKSSNVYCFDCVCVFELFGLGNEDQSKKMLILYVILLIGATMQI